MGVVLDPLLDGQGNMISGYAFFDESMLLEHSSTS
jgi:hypothetical protein